MVRREARPHERQPKTLQWELESNSRKPRDLTEKLAYWEPKKVQHALSQGRKKKEDEIDDEDDDDVVRTSVSQDRVTAVYWGIVPQHSVYIALSTYQAGKNVGGDTDSQHE
jgi:hypothetical protein